MFSGADQEQASQTLMQLLRLSNPTYQVKRFCMLRAITDEVEDKAIEVDEGQEALVVVVMLAMAVRIMAEENTSRPVITTSHMKNREEK